MQDIHHTLGKYELDYLMDDCVLSNISFSKAQWKRLTSESVLDKHKNGWIERMSTSPDFSRFICIHNNLKSSVWWEICRKNLSVKSACFLMVKLCCVLPYNNIQCSFCHKNVLDIVKHVIFDCVGMLHIRDMFWNSIIDRFGVRLYVFLDSLDRDSIVSVLLGGMVDGLLEVIMITDLTDFQTLCCVYMQKFFGSQHLIPTYSGSVEL